MPKKVLLASPRGFCAGVARAVKAVEDTIALFGVPVYVKHEIVHNKHVVADLEKKGARTIETLGEAPEGSVVVFSAHGSPRAHYEEAKKRNVTLIDATCPLVTKVHLEVLRFLREGYTIVYIGHKGHIEGIGVLGEAPNISIPIVETKEDVEKLQMGNPDKLVYLTQTTLSLDETKIVIEALKKKYPQITAPPIEDICYATTNRQTAIKKLAQDSDVVLVFGSSTSSNSKRLREVAEGEGVSAYLIDDISELEDTWIDGKDVIGISAGASAPESVITAGVEFFRKRGYAIEEAILVKEHMRFVEPLELQHKRARKNTE